MSLYDIVNEIPLWVPAAILSLTLVGMSTEVGIRVYKNTKKLNAHLKDIQDNYKDNFSKDELISVYADLVKNVRPNLLGKKRKIAYKISADLEKQIMTYATQETKEAISNGAILDFKDTIDAYSPTYKKAKDVLSSLAKQLYRA